MKIGITSVEFIMLLPIVVLIYYIVPCRFRQYFLLLINLLFYASFGIGGLIVVAVESTIIYVYSMIVKWKRSFHSNLSIEGQSDEKQNKVVAAICIAALLFVLFFFKFGARVNESIVAPLGLSFFTLAAIAYIVDIGKGDFEPESNIIKLITWITFFPTITSGPIYRYDKFITEHNRNVHKLDADYDKITKGIIYMIYGYFLKLVIAERIAIPVSYVFEHFGEQYFNSLVLIAIAISYSIQIYADFAGYSAIVIGIAQILGYYVPENFCAPYFSASVKEFWGRWHISLSSWLKEYVYIPMGGNRKGKVRKYLNVIITFIVSGIWHGTGLHFLMWGGIHAVFQIIGDVTKKLRIKTLHAIRINENSLPITILKRLNTFILVTIAWLFFRTGVKDAIYFILEIFRATNIDKDGIWLFLGLGIGMKDWKILLVSVIIMFTFDVLMYRKSRIDEWLMRKSFLIRGPVLITMLLLILIFGVYGDQHDASYFIYSGF